MEPKEVARRIVRTAIASRPKYEIATYPEGGSYRQYAKSRIFRPAVWVESVLDSEWSLHRVMQWIDRLVYEHGTRFCVYSAFHQWVQIGDEYAYQGQYLDIRFPIASLETDNLPKSLEHAMDAERWMSEEFSA